MKYPKSIRKHFRTVSLINDQLSGRELLKITFPFNRGDLDRVRSLEGRKFHSEKGEKYWTASVTIKNLKKLQNWKFSIDEELAAVNKEDPKQYISAIDGLKGELMPFQLQGVNFIESKNGRGLIADEMGLGKTIQSIAWIQLHLELRPVIIVCPASVKWNWSREIQKWMPSTCPQVIEGVNTNSLILKSDIIIINYDILSSWKEKILQLNPKVLIIDEIHYIKNNKAKRTKAIKQISKYIPHIIGLSGTPILNRPVEAFNICKIIDEGCIPNYWEYTHRYCDAKHNGFGWDFSGASNTDELYDRLSSTIMIRRKKTDVLQELPEKTYSYIPIKLQNRKEYQSAESDFIDYIRKTKGKEKAEKASSAQILTKIESLKQLAVQGKLQHCINWITDFLESDQKLVVFATHKSIINKLMEVFGNIAVKVDGEVTGKNRQQAVDDFQNNPMIRLFIGNIKAAGVGITLTAASNLIFLELPWTPGELDQASDRCHRIGQKNSVTIYYMLAEDTIEIKIIRMLDRKRKVISQVIDGQEVEETSLLTELITSYYND